MTTGTLGFAGLGQMGGPMAANIVKGGFPLVVYDKAGTAGRAPEKSTPVDSLDALAKAAEIIFISLPDGPACLAFARDLAAIQGRATKAVVDLSTIGLAAARDMNKLLAGAGIAYVDAPVSGGQAGARAGTITVMWAGPADLLERLRKVLKAFSKNLFNVGPTPGQGQTVKMLNNFLSATAMAATTEAVSFGLAQGLDMKTILDVVNVSTGRNTASSDKFVNRIMTGTFDAGFKTRLLAKDVRLFHENATAAGTPNEIATVMADIWHRAAEAMPEADFTRIYSFLRGEQRS